MKDGRPPRGGPSTQTALALIGLTLLALGGVAIAVGILPVSDALGVGARVWPVLLFAVAVTVVAELADEAGVFIGVAERLARIGLGRAWLLWVLLALLAVASTVFLSLDTTAVLLTPVVVLVARHNGLSPLPFALTAVWLANTGSLLLPVSNLTNLLAQHALGFQDPGRFAALMAPAALVAVLVPCGVILIVFRRELFRRYERAVVTPASDRPLLIAAGGVVALLIPALLTGVPVWIPASVAAVLLAVVFLVRRRKSLRVGLIPWQLVVFAGGLFLAVEAGHALGLSAVLATVAGQGEDAGALLRLAYSGAIGANAIDNLPAYLALEPVAGSPQRIAALLVGVNAGPLITPWASLATLLWHRRLTALEVSFPWRRYALLGVIVAPLTVGLAALALLL
ncbi:MAG: SLC13 family permease [Pseudolysinimonas sp.]|uniref:SLC13 family permease n=1 Tax=Pseudolysinimonas sp. TaxID=2680009 RepID=UPI003266325D